MTRVLDLNTVQNSLMDLTLQDEARTVVHLEIPTERQVRELEGITSELQKMKAGDCNSVDTLFDMAAQLINCNSDYFRVTSDDLKGRYHMTLYSLVAFFSSYMDCIQGLTNQKN